MAKRISYSERMKWFHQARFGMFIHWGLYSILERGEWVMYQERIPPEEYAPLADRFRPKRFDPNTWVELAKDAGMKYMVLTTRHHDGYCLFDSKASDFTSVVTAAKRDIVAEYVVACRAAGLKVGLYYSLLDWRFPGYWRGPKKEPDSARAMVDQAHAQVRELMTNYGRIDYLFYDGEWFPPDDTGFFGGERQPVWEVTPAEFWQARKLDRMVRRLQPRIIINNRSGLAGDLDTPEQEVKASGKGRAWESCMTIGDFCGLGYIRNNPNQKSVTQLVQHLVTAAAGEGNFLLNIGPKASGAAPANCASRLKAMGRWMKANGEAVYGSGRCPFSGGMIGAWTAKGSEAYLHVFRWPGETACVPGVGNRVTSAVILATGQRARIDQRENGRLFLRGLPRRPPDPHCTVIKVTLDGKPRHVKGCPLGEY